MTCITCLDYLHFVRFFKDEGIYNILIFYSNTINIFLDHGVLNKHVIVQNGECIVDYGNLTPECYATGIFLFEQ